MAHYNLWIGLVMLSVGLQSAGSHASLVDEKKTISIHDEALQHTRPGQEPLLPGYEVTVEISGQIDANHEQWEARECHSLDVFEWFCDNVRHNRTHYQPQSELGVVFQLVGANGEPYAGGTPRSADVDASKFISSLQSGLVPGSSGIGWRYDTSSNTSTLVLTFAPDPGKPNALLEPAYLKSVIGDRLQSSGGDVTRLDCGPIRTCSSGALTVAVKKIDASKRLEMVKTYLKSKRDISKVASTRLIDPLLANNSESADQLVTAVIEYIDNQLAPENLADRGKLLRFAANNLKASPSKNSLLNRKLVNYQIEKGDLAGALPTVQGKLSELAADIAGYENSNKEIPLATSVEYAGWLAAAARIYIKTNEGVVQPDVDRAIGALRTARDVLNKAIRSHERTDEVIRAEGDVAYISVTLARLLSATLVPGDLEEAAQVLMVARYFYAQTHPGALIAGSPIDPVFVVIPSGSTNATETAVSLPMPPGLWKAEPELANQSSWIFRNEDTGRNAVISWDGKQTQVELLASKPEGLKDFPGSQRSVWASERGELWRVEPGQAAVQVYKPSDDNQRLSIVDAQRIAAMVIDAAGAFALIDLSHPPSEPLKGQLSDYEMGGNAQLFVLASNHYLLAWQTQTHLKTVQIDFRTSAEGLVTSGPELTLPNDLGNFSPIEINFHPGTLADSIVALISSDKAIYLARLNANAQSEIEPLKVTAIPPYRIWLSSKGWLVASGARSSDKASMISPVKPTQVTEVKFPTAVSLDRGALKEAENSQGWMVFSDVISTKNLELSDLNNLEDSAQNISFNTDDSQGPRRIRQDGVHVINHSLVVVEHPLIRTLGLYQPSKGLILDIPAQDPENQHTVLGAITSLETHLILDLLPDGAVTQVRNLAFSTIGQWVNSPWSVKPNPCPGDCTASIKLTTDGSTINSHWRLRPGSTPETATFVELLSWPDEDLVSESEAPADTYEVKVRLHSADKDALQTSLRVNSLNDLVGSVRSPNGEFFTFLRDGANLSVLSWETGAISNLKSDLPQGQVQLHPGRSNTGILSIYSGVAPGALTLIPYGFDSDGRPVSLDCSNCSDMAANVSAPGSYRLLGDQDLLLYSKGRCLQVAQLKIAGQRDPGILAAPVSLAGGKSVFATTVQPNNVKQLRVLISADGTNTIINRLGADESLQSCEEMAE